MFVQTYRKIDMHYFSSIQTDTFFVLKIFVQNFLCFTFSCVIQEESPFYDSVIHIRFVKIDCSSLVCLIKRMYSVCPNIYYPTRRKLLMVFVLLLSSHFLWQHAEQTFLYRVSVWYIILNLFSDLFRYSSKKLFHISYQIEVFIWLFSTIPYFALFRPFFRSQSITLLL